MNLFDLTQFRMQLVSDIKVECEGCTYPSGRIFEAIKILQCWILESLFYAVPKVVRSLAFLSKNQFSIILIY